MTEAQPPNQRWDIILTRQAEKALRHLPKILLRSIDRAILDLSQNPHPPEAQQLVGPYDNLYRLKVDEWRIVYAVEDEQRTVLILEIAPKQQPEWYQLDEAVDIGRTSEEQSPEEKFIKPDYGALEKILAKLTDAERRTLFSFSEMEPLDIVKSRFLFLNLIKQAGWESVQPGDAAWYVIYCPSGYEHNVKQSLLSRIETMAMQDKILQVVVPGETEAWSETESQQPLPHQTSPGAILIEMILDDDSWYVVKNTPGVSAFFGSEGKPTPLRPEEVDKLIHYLGSETGNLELINEPSQEKIRLLITGENSETLGELYLLLDSEPDLEIVGITPNSEEGYQLAQERAPDIVLTQLNLSVTTFQQFPAPETPVTQILVRDGIDYLAGSTLGEARERLIWPGSKDVLIDSIRRVYRSRGGEVEARQRQVKVVARWFEQCKLGDYIEISLSITNLTESLAFYQKLGLRQVDGEETPYPWAVLSDGRLHLGLHQRSFPSPALSYLSSFPRKWRTGAAFRLSLLQMLAIIPDQVEQIGTKSMLRKQNGYPIAASFQADGQYVLLADVPFKKPSAGQYSLPFRNFLTKHQTFGELSLRTNDVAASVAYWQRLGFKQLAGDNKPYPWALVTDGRVRLGLHQAARFTQPALSYFAPDMPERLEQLEQQGLQLVSTRKDAQGRSIGALIHSPDGQPILLFAGEIKN